MFLVKWQCMFPYVAAVMQAVFTDMSQVQQGHMRTRNKACCKDRQEAERKQRYLRIIKQLAKWSVGRKVLNGS